MYSSLKTLLGFAIFFTRVSASGSNYTDPSYQLIHEFPNPTWIENLVVTSDNHLMVTDITNPYLYIIDPSVSSADPSSNSTATILHSFTPELSLLGITELSPSQFYVVTRNFTLTSLASVTTGVNSIYSVDLTGYNYTSNTGAVVSKTAVVLGAGSFNGLATLSESQNLLLAADAIYGVIYAINVATGEYEIVVDIPETNAPNSTSLAFGVNGIKVLASSDDADSVYIYFDNTGLSLFCRIPFSISAMNATGPVEILSDQYSTDDFCLDADQGVAYIAYSGEAQVLKMELEGGEVTPVLGGLNDIEAGTNETLLSGPTSVQLGRAGDGLGWAYVSQSGKNSSVYTEGGKVLAFEIGTA